MDDIPVIRWSVAMERNDMGGFVNYHDYTMLYERIESMREDMQRRIRIGKESSDEIDALRARVAELERERDQLALSLSATRAERDHAVRSAELWESEHRAGYEAMGVYKHLWLEGRAIMAVCGYFSRMRGPDVQLAYKQFGSGYTRRYLKSEDAIKAHLDDGYKITPLYSGSAPVPAAQAEAKVSVGDSRFESWFAQYNPSGKGDKQRARDAYAAGMSDPAEAKMADALVQDAWTFVYEPETNFVGAYHTRGGKQSICEITNPTYRYELGVRIAELLNTYGIGNGAMLAAKAKGGGK